MDFLPSEYTTRRKTPDPWDSSSLLISYISFYSPLSLRQCLETPCDKAKRIRVILTAHRGGIDIKSRLLQPRRDRDVIANEAGHVAAHKYVVAEEAAGTLHFRVVTLVHHCNNGRTQR